MGDDCFLSSAGARCDVEVVAAGIAEANWAGMASMGECSGVCVECDVLRDWRLPLCPASAMITSCRASDWAHLARQVFSCACCCWQPYLNRVHAKRRNQLLRYI